MNLNVNFDHDKCLVTDVDDKCILEGLRSSDNLYTLKSPTHLSQDWLWWYKIVAWETGAPEL